jgi:hypothetical protein
LEVREFQLWTDRRPLVTALFRTFNLIDSSGTWLPSLNSPLTSITCQDRPTWLQTPSVSHPIPPPFPQENYKAAEAASTPVDTDPLDFQNMAIE